VKEFIKEMMIMIPCDICGKDVDFDGYEEHYNLHLKSQQEPKEENNGGIPCETCGEIILFGEYDKHLKVHAKETDESNKKQK
jgi:endogenous inhibitor of DNA gyrase (YacG/DUF329 family)